MASGGPSTAGLFELKRPVRYLFQTNGMLSIPVGSRARTRLNNVTSGWSADIAGADVGAGSDAEFRLLTSASLLLDPGRYNWISEVNVNPVTAPQRTRLRIDVANSPDAIETLGIRQAYSCMSGATGTQIYAEGFFEAAIGPAETMTARLTVTDLTSDQQFASPVIEVAGATHGEVSTGVVPYLLTAGRVYRATMQLHYAGSRPVRCRLRQRIG